MHVEYASDCVLDLQTVAPPEQVKTQPVVDHFFAESFAQAASAKPMRDPFGRSDLLLHDSDDVPSCIWHVQNEARIREVQSGHHSFRALASVFDLPSVLCFSRLFEHAVILHSILQNFQN